MSETGRKKHPCQRQEASIAVPLFFLTWRIGNGILPAGIARHAPGCTSRRPPSSGFQPVTAALFLKTAAVTLSVQRALIH